jgi:hypothetical protein
MHIHRAIKRHYFAPVSSCAALLTLSIYYLCLAVPFYVTFTGRSFWNQLAQAPLVTNLQHTGEYLLVLHKLDGTNSTYSNALLRTLDGAPIQAATLSSNSQSLTEISFDLTLPAPVSNCISADLFLVL